LNPITTRIEKKKEEDIRSFLPSYEEKALIAKNLQNHFDFPTG
jgi:hypothetical protein